jgi:hypothetical protein
MIPKSFITDGFYNPNAPKKRRRLLIGIDGPTNSGKTEFGLSAPGPGICLCLDPGYEGMEDKEEPPASRNPDIVFKHIKVKMREESKGTDEYVKDWIAYRDLCYKAYANVDCLSVILDGDGDSYELQTLAEFGKVTQIPQLARDPLMAKRKLFIRRAFDSGKNIIATYKVKQKWVPIIDPITGEPVRKDGRIEKEAHPTDMDRRGFPDQDYLYMVQLRTMRRKSEDFIIPAGPKKGQVKPGKTEFGIIIMKCKIDTKYEGVELWNDKCCFKGLVELLYPHSSPADWGM